MKQNPEKVNDVETLTFSIQKLFLLRFRTNCFKNRSKKGTRKKLIIPIFSTETYYNITAKNCNTYWKISKHQKRKIATLRA